MYSTQAIEDIRESLLETKGVNLTFCVCDNQAFNSIVRAYRHGDITLERATIKAYSTIIDHPKKKHEV